MLFFKASFPFSELLTISATVFKTVFALMLITVSSPFQFQIIPGTPRPTGLDITAFNITSNPMCQKFETANTSKNFCKGRSLVHVSVYKLVDPLLTYHDQKIF